MKYFKLRTLCALLLAALALSSCAQNTPGDTAAAIVTKQLSDTVKDSEKTAETETPSTESETEPEETRTLSIWKPGTKTCAFNIVYDQKADDPKTAEAEMLTALITNYTGAKTRTKDTSKTSAKEIVLSSSVRPEMAAMLEGLQEGEYAVRVLPGEKEDEGKLLIATTTYRSAYTCAEYLLQTYYSDESGFCVPIDLDVKGRESGYTLINSSIKKLRDPFILVEDGVYYAYGTGWKCYKNDGGKLKGPWEDLGVVASVANADTDGGSHWAPEVHKYNGAYYMFTTYLNGKTNHRGCIILRSDSPEGPFTEITNGHITPSDWDCIDGTFYVDPDGQPWMVFVHEWTSMKDGIGSFAAAKLSDDLTRFISEPIELFKAKDTVWAQAGVTDGCFMYTTKEGDLLMLWSNFDQFGYSVAVARSSNGRLDGEWTHEKNLLYSKCMTNKYDGGHAMVFTDTDGQMYIAFHSPNTATDDRKEKPVFLAIEEKDGRLVWKTDDR